MTQNQRSASAVVCLDPRFLLHPKVADAGPLAALLFLGGLGYCAQQLTDGYIPERIVPTLVNLDGIFVLDSEGRIFDTPTPAMHPDLAFALCRVGLWDVAPGGFLVHDYLDWNPSRQETAAYAEPDERRRGGLVRAARAERARGRFVPDFDSGTAPLIATESAPVDRDGSGERRGKTVPAPGGPAGVRALSTSSSTSSSSSRSQERESQLDQLVGERRRELFAALATAEGSTPGGMTARGARACGVSLSEIHRATPDITPEEIARRAANYRGHFRGRTLTTSDLAKHWDLCARGPEPTSPFEDDYARMIASRNGDS